MTVYVTHGSGGVFAVHSTADPDRRGTSGCNWPVPLPPRRGLLPERQHLAVPPGRGLTPERRHLLADSGRSWLPLRLTVAGTDLPHDLIAWASAVGGTLPFRELQAPSVEPTGSERPEATPRRHAPIDYLSLVDYARRY